MYGLPLRYTPLGIRSARPTKVLLAIFHRNSRGWSCYILVLSCLQRLIDHVPSTYWTTIQALTSLGAPAANIGLLIVQPMICPPQTVSIDIIHPSLRNLSGTTPLVSEEAFRPNEWGDTTWLRHSQRSRSLSILARCLRVYRIMRMPFGARTSLLGSFRIPQRCPRPWTHSLQLCGAYALQRSTVIPTFDPNQVDREIYKSNIMTFGLLQLESLMFNTALPNVICPSRNLVSWILRLLRKVVYSREFNDSLHGSLFNWDDSAINITLTIITVFIHHDSALGWRIIIIAQKNNDNCSVSIAFQQSRQWDSSHTVQTNY